MHDLDFIVQFLNSQFKRGGSGPKCFNMFLQPCSFAHPWPPDSSVGGKRPADQCIDQAITKRPRMAPRMATLTEEDTDSLSDAQLQTALGRLEEESKRKVAQRAAVVQTDTGLKFRWHSPSKQEEIRRDLTE